MRPSGAVCAAFFAAGCALSVAASQVPPQLASDEMTTMPELPRPPRPHRFEDAKRALRSQVYDEAHRVELYCGCAYDAAHQVDFTRCESASPYTPVEVHHARADHIEWEHVVPASWIGRVMPCWSDPLGRGRHRDFCRDTSEAFAFAEGDMHDLFPSIGQLNALRDDDSYGEVEGEPHIAGCDFERDAVTHLVEPRDAVRGDVARATFYVSAVYRVPLRRTLRERLRRWHRADPPDAFERLRNERIERIQGNANPYVTGVARP